MGEVSYLELKALLIRIRILSIGSFCTVSYYNTQRVEELGSVEKSQVQRMAKKNRLTPELVFLRPSWLAVSKSAKKGILLNIY